jgi:hypothetical protein
MIFTKKFAPLKKKLFFVDVYIHIQYFVVSGLRYLTTLCPLETFKEVTAVNPLVTDGYYSTRQF